jgi:hypothetical protein
MILSKGIDHLANILYSVPNKDTLVLSSPVEEPRQSDLRVGKYSHVLEVGGGKTRKNLRKTLEC